MMVNKATVPWTAKVLTLFPEMFPGPLGWSLAGKALENRVWELEAINIRTYAYDKRSSVDDTPYGGGVGMVMRADILDEAIEASLMGHKELPVIYLSPRGYPLTQKRVQELATGPGVVLLCGRYEGIDERVLIRRCIEEISLGDYVLSGGEPAALVLIDACIRLLPNVMGNCQSREEESFEGTLLEYPHYTKPRKWQGMDVPVALMSGHHEKIRQWRLAKAEKITQKRRPDLWKQYVSSRNRQKGG